MKAAILTPLLFAVATVAQTLPTGCVAQENTCRTAPNANQAFCSSQRASCDAYCNAQENACRVAPNANQAFCSAQRAGCVQGNPGTGSNTTTPAPPGPTPTPISYCQAQENACRTAPNANQAFCSSQRAQCNASGNSTITITPPIVTGSPTSGSGNGTVTTTSLVPPTQYTGAAAHHIAESIGGVAIMAAGMVLML